MSSQEPVSRHWSPIEDLPEDWRETLVDKAVQAAMQAWIDRAEELRQSDAYKEFTERLHRRWSIETGIIEDAYTVSRSATETLIQHGLDAALISHEDVGNEEPIEVLRKIEDHQRAIQGLYSFVSDQRPLGVSFIRELHQVLMAHQQTYLAVDQFGNRGPRQLKLGDWKTWPNHVDLPGGGRFEYCPPEQVASELDQLVEWHRQHLDAGVPPDIEAAWLHHRFTLIHPFEDGNGRVARTLATMVLLKGRWLPMVIDRKEKPQYIDAIRKADNGDLQPLIKLIGAHQLKELRAAVSYADQLVQTEATVSSQILSIAARLQQRVASADNSRQQAIALSIELWRTTSQQLKETVNNLNIVFQSSTEYRAYFDCADFESERSYFFAGQIIEAAKKLNYFADRNIYQSWCRLTIQGVDRFEFLVAFHGIGRSQIGYLGCVPMTYRRNVGDYQNSPEQNIRWGEVVPLSDSPFEFSYSERSGDVLERFDPWLEARISEALAIWERDL
ncbi:filamentation induced by cAMP protein Fic [Planctopirus limnophila DSM 3776]|uniref:Filamentation induced by cAMP protein Fic n=1 Tax=Planctopirus limnophila (strain ATCC 43296 / DSM 3776 / IFAM 1008 / Mu 290) TaxID=521674 RepID=D5SXB5_PLAL2|nr:Fic family protein [Planctopirus limnophila]ADG69737.1 filamentation induced by cAMP protein Fic [Planctopirus limnophila DSM 3776]